MQGICIGCGKNILSELKCRQRKFLRKLAIFSFLIFRKICTSTHKALVAILKKSHLIHIQTKAVLLIIHSLHPLEQRSIERYIHRELCHLRSDLLSDLLHGIACVSLHYIIEYAGNLVEGLSRKFHRFNSVLESRLIRIGCYGIDLSLTLCDSSLKGREIMFCLDLVKLRRSERSL